MDTKAQFRSQRRRSRVPGILLASLVFHGLVLTPLALNLFGSMSERRVARQQTPIYIDILPRPQLGDERPRARAQAASAERETDIVRRDSRLKPPPVVARSRSDRQPESTPVPAPDAPADDRWRVRPDEADDRIAPALRRSAAGCRTMAGRLQPAEQAHCDQAFANSAARSAAITGTNDPVRDARFAAVGDQALADYDRRRAPLKPNSRANPSPESPNPGDPGAFTIKGRLWSSRDGILPDLPGRQ